MKITPRDACELASVAMGDPDKAKDFLLIWLSAGQIRADAAVTQKPNSAPVMDKKISPDVWAKFKTKCPSSLWDTGTASSDHEEYVGVRFDGAQVQKIVANHAPKSPTASNVGRDSGFHGDAVAALTVQYLLADNATFLSASPSSLADELKAEYDRIGATPPSPRNLKSMAKGILKVVELNRPKVHRGA
jgi:hypothetical protein